MVSKASIGIGLLFVAGAVGIIYGGLAHKGLPLALGIIGAVGALVLGYFTRAKKAQIDQQEMAPLKGNGGASSEETGDL